MIYEVKGRHGVEKYGVGDSLDLTKDGGCCISKYWSTVFVTWAEITQPAKQSFFHVSEDQFR